MTDHLPEYTSINKELTIQLEQLRLEFVNLFTRHKDMVENESAILTSLYLQKLGNLQLELLQKQTEVARLKMKMNLVQAAINRDEQPNLQAIENLVNAQMQDYYAQIEAQAAALNEAREVLSHLISEEETAKLKEIFRVLCKKLHPDLNPNQTEEEKDLFVRVKSAYDLNQLAELQRILLYLENSKKEKLPLVSIDEKQEQIRHLEENIASLKSKIEQLKQNFPFTIEELIFNNDYISQRQEEIRTQIKTSEDEITKYQNIINIMTDE
ncbi:MAG: J domain-containing protein [Mariniphaga sp.]